MAYTLIHVACVLAITMRTAVGDIAQKIADLEAENRELGKQMDIAKKIGRAQSYTYEQAIFHLELEYTRLSREVYKVLSGDRRYIQVAKKTEQMLKFAGLNLEHGKPFLLSLAIGRISHDKARPTSTALKFMLADIPADKSVRMSGLLFGLNGIYIKSVAGEIRATGTSTPITTFGDSPLDGIQLTFDSIPLQADIEYEISVSIVYDETWPKWHSFGYELLKSRVEDIRVKPSAATQSAGGRRSKANSMPREASAAVLASDIILQVADVKVVADPPSAPKDKQVADQN